MRKLSVLSVLMIIGMSLHLSAQKTITKTPDSFSQFIVPGHEKDMETIRDLYWYYYKTCRPAVPLWDEWLPMSTLWPAFGEDTSVKMRALWANALSSRIFDSEGYIVTEQHDGLAHSEGWPFPLWTQGNGYGWHFQINGVPGYDALITRPDGWTVKGGNNGKIVNQGWEISLTGPEAMLETPPFSVDAKIFPWLRLNWWAEDMEGADCYVEWMNEGQTSYPTDQRAYFAMTKFDQRKVGPPSWAPPSKISYDSTAPIARTMIPVYRINTWKGKVTRLRIVMHVSKPQKIVIRSFHVAFDSRHNINNINFIRGCHDYFMWTRDIAFLRSQIGRIRTSMRFIEREFDTHAKHCIYTSWPGHEGRCGAKYINGKRSEMIGEGIGSNYWDLLPFGGEDALASIYYYDALLDLAALEEQIAKHPEWCVAKGADAYVPSDLKKHAQEVKDYGNKRFWNNATGRFGTVDLDGGMHDYGFTFLNNEAVYFSFATLEHAASIHSWINGDRIVKGDSSVGKDIYKWRFGPRSSTLRNKEYYIWPYNADWVSWGNSVQDGGAILAWSFYDLMARIQTAGPDDAEPLLHEIVKWYDDVRAEGGFRAYYKKDPSRGTLQGDNVGGGIGVDAEFIESILVPQVMLYGFLGFKPTADGFSVNPKLPSDWPELKVTGIKIHQSIVDVRVTRDKKVFVKGVGSSGEKLIISAPEGFKVVED